MGMSENVYPTHDCFTDSLELFDALLRQALKSGIDARRDLFLVHAICAFPDGERYAHAWIEDGLKDMAMFYGILDGKRRVFAAQTIADYRAHHGVIEAYPYTYDEAIQQNHAHGHYGPWIEGIRQYCSDQRRVFYPDSGRV